MKFRGHIIQKKQTKLEKIQMNLDQIQMKDKIQWKNLDKIQTKIKQNLDKIYTQFRTRSRLTHSETFQTNLEKKLDKFRRIQNTSEFRQIQTKYRQIQNTLVH